MKSEASLLSNAYALSGYTIAELALKLNKPLPENPQHAKGFIGTLLESALGASASNRNEPDFPELGIELKTIPINTHGRPRESTFVCTLPYAKAIELDYAQSPAAKKLERVLFIPIEDSRVPFAIRRVGCPVLWSPNHDERKILEEDWQLVASRLLSEGDQAINAYSGIALQVRPKAQNGKVRHITYDDSGPQWTHPRGLYLRATFTANVLHRIWNARSQK